MPLIPKRSFSIWRIQMMYRTAPCVRTLILTCSLFGSGFVAATGGHAENLIDIVPDEQVDSSVQLTPATIAGLVNLGGQNITRIDLEARSTDYAAKLTQTSEGPYVLTVNVPDGSTLDYAVSGLVYMDNYTTRMFLDKETVPVTNGDTTVHDLIIDSGYVRAELVADGCQVASSEIWAMKNDSSGYSKATTKRTTETTYRFPVQPNSGITVYGQVQLSTGQTHTLTSRQVDILPGQETAVSWELNCVPGQLGAIKHDVDYHMPIDYHMTYLYNEGSWSPYRTANHAGSTLFDNLAPSSWRMLTYSYWNNYQNLIAKEITDIATQSGETTSVVFDQYPGFVRGTLNLEGTHTLQDTSYAHIYAYGENGSYPSDGVFSRALANNVDGAFNLALPQGEYRAWVSAYSFYQPDNPADYLRSYMYMYDYSRRSDLLYIDAAQEIEGYGMSYETGAAVIKFSMADGGVFSSPYIVAKSYTYNDSGALDSYVYTTSYGYAGGDTVTMVGFPGTYEVEAWAYVDGSLTTFGKVEIEIVPGVKKVIDIGGPALDVMNPAAGAVFEASSVVVEGVATDDSGIERITVNGVDVQFVSTNNPDDEHEVIFSVEILLQEGENAIVTEATDTHGNLSSDNRTVSYALPDPVTEEEDVPQGIAGILDIKPGSCTNPFNVQAQGVLPVVLLGSEEFDVQAIDVASLTLNGVTPLRTVIDDAAALVAEGECENDFGDGTDDLIMKFDRQALAATLGEVADGETVTLELAGETVSGRAIEAGDSVRIIKKESKSGKK